MNILSVAAHQDDIEMNCLGTLIKYARQGHKLTNLVMTNGDKGGQFDLTLPLIEVTAIREREAGELARRLGARYVCLGETDGYLSDTACLRDVVAEIIRQVRPDVVFVPPAVDYHLDHSETSRIALQAALTAAFATHRTASPPLAYYPAIFYMEPTCGNNWLPSHYVDITETIGEKCELLKCHESQMKNMETSSGWNLIEYAEIVGRFRGLQSGVKYAESFLNCTLWPRASVNNNLLP